MVLEQDKEITIISLCESLKLWDKTLTIPSIVNPGIKTDWDFLDISKIISSDNFYDFGNEESIAISILLKDGRALYLTSNCDGKK
jgi:hypothetical protein